MKSTDIIPTCMSISNTRLYTCSGGTMKICILTEQSSLLYLSL